MTKPRCLFPRNRLIKTSSALLALLTLPASSWGGVATSDPRFKSPLEVTPEPSPWEFQVSTPLWLPNVSGDVGMRGRTAGIEVGLGTIMKEVKGAAAFSFQVRNGRWGVNGDFNYLSTEQEESSKLLNTLNLRADQTITSLDLSYRVWEAERGWVELYAGARYMSLYNQLELEPDTKAIEKGAERLVDRALSRVKGEIEHLVAGALEGRHPDVPIPPLAQGVSKELVAIVEELKADPELVRAIASKDRPRIKKAKERVRKEMARRIRKVLDRDYSTNHWWIDPYVGVQAQINLTQAVYLKGRGDVGGFGVGSTFAWNLYAGLGVNITRHIYSEVGYRHLYSDYSNAGFTYDMTIQGAQITVGVNF